MTLKHNTIIILILSFIAGILWQHLNYNLTIAAGLMIFFFAATFLLKKTKKQIFVLFTIFILFFVGILRYQTQQTKQEKFYHQFGNRKFDIIAKVADIAKQDSKIYKNCITVKTKKTKLQLYVKKLPDIKVGDLVKFKKLKFKIPDPLFSRYLMKENIATNVFVNNLDYEIVKRPYFSFSRWIFNIKNRLLESIKTKMGKKSFSMFSSIFLGNRKINKKENDQMKNRFRLWGILHFLARSGLHLIIFFLLCELLIKCIPVNFNIKQIMLIILSTIYLLLSWPSLSFIRAFSVFLLYKFCPLLHKKQNLLHLVAIVCFAMLIYNPIQLFFLDFQLSFGLTLALAIFANEKIKRERKEKLKTIKSNKSFNR